ncbi:leucyl/phenylalanyl-tRNA--protein transferase [Novosphingobium sp. KACC 22771]|uniref:leucyl/phenylalanyl-tRNA--protein transferase n=1 Tax=Novosphingobium sp. KACC 22771 TaxID=3025670 RepID=UPI002365ECD4|nr:leucyl/phenylalanyl-tRNA--protein transferase [Novosphingobium sp. KACC 22771]WDF73017.1 leucyl/phenylalanyl-tRNA--protein transferase [Novosphingobium sp. KACC 22771]
MENFDLIDPALLLLAYRGGVFPMADSRDDPEIFWVEPKRRGILPLDGFRVSHSLARSLRREKFTVTCNAAFDLVLDACAAPRRAAEGEDGGETWISARIAASYRELHRLGHAHSIECWIDGALVGGLYGVGFERVFCGESMFSRVPDASKVALAWLVAAMRIGGAQLLDCQFITSHLASLGAIEIPQKRYLAMLREAMKPREPGLPPQSGFSGAAGAGAGAMASALGVALALPDAFGALLETAKSAGFSSSPGKFIAQSLTQTS